MKTDTVTFYAYYASALVNDDFSGLETFEHAMIESFLTKLRTNYGPTARIIGTINSSEQFAQRGHYMELAGDSIDYVVAYE